MKANSKIVSAVLAAALLLPSCSKRAGEGDAAFLTEIHARVSGIDIDGGSRTSLSQDGKFQWMLSDRLAFIPAQSSMELGRAPSQVLFYVDQNASSGYATFKGDGWGLLRGKLYYSYYPYSPDAECDNISISYEGQCQNGNASTAHLGAYDYLQASVPVPETGTADIDFKRIGCLVRFTFNVPAPYSDMFTFTSLTLSSDSDVFVRSVSYNPSEDYGDGDVTLLNPRKSSTMTIRLNGCRCDEDGRLVVYAMMAPTSWKGADITATLDAMSNSFTCSITPSRNAESGGGYGFTRDVTLTGVYDLSASESANCYVVSEKGDYKFRMLKGNSDESVAGVRGVKVLWRSFNTAVTPSDGDIIKSVELDGDFVKFSTSDTFTEGNAVIAVYEDAGCTGDVLWNWHIWCTDAPVPQKYFNGAGYLMDRNLGALDVTGDLSIGLFYQWGRKDPFAGTLSLAPPFNWTAQDISNDQNLAFQAGQEISLDTDGTLAKSIANPCTFYIQSQTSDLDWEASNETEERTWFGTGGLKTQYDPCPPGYKVPSGSTSALDNSYSGFFAKAWGIQHGISVISMQAQTPQGGTVVYDKTTNMMRIPLEDGGFAYLPATGCITESGKRACQPGRVFLWSDYPMGSGDGISLSPHYSSLLNVDLITGATGAYSWNESNGAFIVNFHSGRAAGKPVRCCRISSGDSTSGSQSNESFTPPSEASPW